MQFDRRSFLAATAVAALAPAAGAQPAIDHAALARRAIDQSILPAFDALADAAARLDAAARAACAGGGGEGAAALLEAPYHAAFDAWCGAGHYQFGALEEDGRGFSVAFWPDNRGRAARALARLISAEDPAIDDPKAFAAQSVAAQGLFALEHLMFDPDAPALDGYRCRLAAAIGAHLAQTTATLAARWRAPFAGLLLSAGAADNPLYRAPEEATLQLFKALDSGLEFNAQLRLGRPLGTFDRPRPRLAEAWRSGRSLRNLTLSLEAQRAFFSAVFAPATPAADGAAIMAAFDDAIDAAKAAPTPLGAAVADLSARLRIESLKTKVDAIRRAVSDRLAPRIGAGVTFNSLDGD